jgi:hypothetical protein
MLVLWPAAAGEEPIGSGNGRDCEQPCSWSELARSDNGYHARHRDVLAKCVRVTFCKAFLLCLYVERMPDWRKQKQTGLSKDRVLSTNANHQPQCTCMTA